MGSYEKKYNACVLVFIYQSNNFRWQSNAIFDSFVDEFVILSFLSRFHRSSHGCNGDWHFTLTYTYTCVFVFYLTRHCHYTKKRRRENIRKRNLNRRFCHRGQSNPIRIRQNLIKLDSFGSCCEYIRVSSTYTTNNTHNSFMLVFDRDCKIFIYLYVFFVLAENNHFQISLLFAFFSSIFVYHTSVYIEFLMAPVKKRNVSSDSTTRSKLHSIKKKYYDFHVIFLFAIFFDE